LCSAPHNARSVPAAVMFPTAQGHHRLLLVGTQN
jgi:hypothetical protein